MFISSLNCLNIIHMSCAIKTINLHFTVLKTKPHFPNRKKSNPVHKPPNGSGIGKSNICKEVVSPPKINPIDVPSFAVLMAKQKKINLSNVI